MLKSGKKGIVKKVTTALELPKEITLNLPLISMVGGEDLTIENYKGVIEYSAEKIRISAVSGDLKIEGARLSLKYITKDSVAVTGGIKSIEFL